MVRKQVMISILFLSFPFWGASTSGSGAHQNTATVVSNPKIPQPTEGPRKRLLFSHELTIGVEEGDENYMFGNSVQVVADDQGSFYVSDFSRKRIQKYDLKGKYIFSIGRQGQGPGDIGSIDGMRIDPAGSIYVTDRANGRVSFFSTADGLFQKQFRIDQDIKNAAIFLSNGLFFSKKDIMQREAGILSLDFLFGLFDEKCQLVTELFLNKGGFKSPRRPPGGARAEYLAELVSDMAFKPQVVSQVTQDERILIGYSETCEIKVFDRGGKLLQIIRKDADSQKVSQEHKDFYFKNRVLTFLRREDLAFKDDIRKLMNYPKFLPAYQAFIPMDNGWLFVIVDALGKISKIDLFDQQGRYIGQFETDLPLSSLFFKNGKAYAVATIGDYNFVQRYGYRVVDY